MSKRGRRPTPEDLALWETVSKDVAPLTRRPKPAAERQEEPKPPAEPKAKPAPPAAQPLKVIARPPPPSPQQPPALAPLDRRMRARVTRGAVAIDARIDLHGLTQAAAHRRLIKFLGEAQAAAAKLVLVITGKGRPDDRPVMGEERGVLKRLVPIWLGAEEMRPLVVGYETAGRGHGGEGALYVRVRSRRKAGG
jgi:DNA-nicking Smr family endonuclease